MEQSLRQVFAGVADGHNAAIRKAEYTIGPVVAVNDRGEKQFANVPGWCHIKWLDPFGLCDRRFVIVQKN